MSSYGSIWVKVDKPEIDLPTLHDGYNPNATLPAGKAFACAAQNAADEETPTSQMQELSQKFGEAIFMTVQTTVDFFIYSHWRDGALAREIQYSADIGWYGLEGGQEGWEERLFSEEDRLRQLGYLELEDLAKNPESDNRYAEAQAQAAQIAAVWGAKELQENSFYPMASASEIYQIVMQTFGLANPYGPH